MKARIWAYNKLIGLSGIIRAYKAGCRNFEETVEFLEVMDEFLNEAVNSYQSKYGICRVVDNYIIY